MSRCARSTYVPCCARCSVDALSSALRSTPHRVLPEVSKVSTYLYLAGPTKVQSSVLKYFMYLKVSTQRLRSALIADCDWGTAIALRCGQGSTHSVTETRRWTWQARLWGELVVVPGSIDRHRSRGCLDCKCGRGLPGCWALGRARPPHCPDNWQGGGRPSRPQCPGGQDNTTPTALPMTPSSQTASHRVAATVPRRNYAFLPMLTCLKHQRRPRPLPLNTLPT